MFCLFMFVCLDECRELCIVVAVDSYKTMRNTHILTFTIERGTLYQRISYIRDLNILQIHGRAIIAEPAKWKLQLATSK